MKTFKVGCQATVGFCAKVKAKNYRDAQDKIHDLVENSFDIAFHKSKIIKDSALLMVKYLEYEKF